MEPVWSPIAGRFAIPGQFRCRCLSACSATLGFRLCFAYGFRTRLLGRYGILVASETPFYAAIHLCTDIRAIQRHQTPMRRPRVNAVFAARILIMCWHYELTSSTQVAWCVHSPVYALDCLDSMTLSASLTRHQTLRTDRLRSAIARIPQTSLIQWQTYGVTTLIRISPIVNNHSSRLQYNISYSIPSPLLFLLLFLLLSYSKSYCYSIPHTWLLRNTRAKNYTAEISYFQKLAMQFTINACKIVRWSIIWTEKFLVHSITNIPFIT